MADTLFIPRATNIVSTWLNQINRYVFGGATAASIRSLDKTIYTRFRTVGYYAAGDGGGGDYYLDLADTTSADNGGTVFVAVDGGRWKLVYSGEVSALQFGMRGNNSFDNSAAFQAALNAAAGNFKLKVPNGTYLFTTASSTYQLPGDDGTTAPAWHGSGDVNIAAETPGTMPVVAVVPTGIVLEGESRDGVIFQGAYNVTASPVNTSQQIFMSLGNSLLTYWTGSISNITIQGWFIGAIGQGVTYRSTFKNLLFSQVAIPWNGQNSDGATEWNGITMQTCYAGLTQGGRWLMRDRTSFDINYIPPYPASDVQLVGWCDNTYWERIEWSSGIPYDSRAASIDTFFDTYFYKSANSAVYPAGRASVNFTAGEWNGFGTYRGIVGFPVKVMSRYGRYSFGLHASRFITNNHPRSQFYADFLSRSYIGDFYGETIGFAAGGAVFGTTVPDPYHAGQPVGFGIWIDQGDIGNFYGHMGGVNTASGLGTGQVNLTSNIGSQLTVVGTANLQGGINFANGGSTPPGTTGQTMTNYEEGTWTPSDGSGAGLTFTGNFTFTRIGRLVIVSMDITFPATASGAAIQINGLPFSTFITGTSGWAMAHTTSNLSATWTYGGSSSLVVRTLADVAVTNSQMSGKSTTGCFIYFIS